LACSSDKGTIHIFSLKTVKEKLDIIAKNKNENMSNNDKLKKTE